MAVADPDPGALTEASVVRRSPFAATVPVDGHAILVDGPGGRAHAINPTAALVWGCLDGTGDLGGLIDDLVAGFEVPRAIVADDVLGLARDLARLGLLDGFGAAAGAWPEDLASRDDDCPPGAGDPAAISGRADVSDPAGPADPSFDDRYLTAPPNG